ncbi:hypothetical protein BGX30_002264, partial [Mortierella sp. GBA39]
QDVYILTAGTGADFDAGNDGDAEPLPGFQCFRNASHGVMVGNRHGRESLPVGDPDILRGWLHPVGSRRMRMQVTKGHGRQRKQGGFQMNGIKLPLKFGVPDRNDGKQVQCGFMLDRGRRQHRNAETGLNGGFHRSRAAKLHRGLQALWIDPLVDQHTFHDLARARPFFPQHKRIGKHFLQLDRFPLRQGMADRHDQLQLVLHDGIDDHIRMVDRRLDQAEIQLMLPAAAGSMRCHRIVRFLNQGDALCRIRQKGDPRFGQLDLLGGADQQARPEIFLQGLNLHRNGRLGHVQRARRRRETPTFRHGIKNVELVPQLDRLRHFAKERHDNHLVQRISADVGFPFDLRKFRDDDKILVNQALPALKPEAMV